MFSKSTKLVFPADEIFVDAVKVASNEGVTKTALTNLGNVPHYFVICSDIAEVYSLILTIRLYHRVKL